MLRYNLRMRRAVPTVLLLAALVALLALLAACGGGMEPTATGPRRQRGILLMAHGGSPEWNAEVEAAVEPLRVRWPVEISYGMAVPSSIEAAVARLEARGVTDIAVVRLFVSGESWREETRYILGLRADLPAEPIRAHAAPPHHAPAAGPGHAGHVMEPPRRIAHRARISMSQDGVGDSALIDAILVDRVRALSADPARETVLVIAHGPGDDAEDQRWIAGMKQRLAGLAAVGAFRRVEVATLREDWPEKRPAAEKRIRTIVDQGNTGGGRVIVVPFRVAGFGPYRDVLAGQTYVSDGKGFLPHANVTRWIERTAESVLTSTARR